MVVFLKMRTMRKGLHIGTCGWSYPEWKGIFYSGDSGFVRQYLSYFDVAEINATFYGPLKEDFMNFLRLELPPEKFFTAKIPHIITHNNRLDLKTEAGPALSDFFVKTKTMIDRLDALLIQLPPWDITTFGDLELFFNALDTDYRFAVEFRHESWLKSSVFRLLEKYNLAYTIVDEPRLPIDMRVTADFAYVRLHGHGDDPWYNYMYSLKELKAWRPRLEQLLDEVGTVLVFFNNHFFGYGPTNALQMMDLLGSINPSQNRKMERMLKQLSVKQTSLDEF
jgi:uncharacterized protein YecE (DUF72 family)